jgi:23S rRNA pseudouridine1911/1915/1917 synthase
MSIDEELDPVESEDDLFEHFNFVVDKGQQLLRIDKYLQLKISNSSRSKIQLGIDAGSVKVNGGVIKANYRVKPLDIISVSFSQPPRDKDLYPENIAINIIYEDEDVLIVDKAAGMVVHPAHGNWSGTLVNALLYHCQQLPGKQEVRPGLVHRIDKDTSGILVVAKSEFALTYLAKQFFDHTIQRTYFAICWGVPKIPIGTLRGKIATLGLSYRNAPKDQAIYRFLLEENVVSSSPSAKDVIGTIDDIGKGGDIYVKFFGKFGEMMKKGYEVAESTYVAGDDFYKIYNFLAEFDTYKNE